MAALTDGNVIEIISTGNKIGSEICLDNASLLSLNSLADFPRVGQLRTMRKTPVDVVAHRVNAALGIPVHQEMFDPSAGMFQARAPNPNCTVF